MEENWEIIWVNVGTSASLFYDFWMFLKHSMKHFKYNSLARIRFEYPEFCKDTYLRLNPDNDFRISFGGSEGREINRI